MPARSKTGNYNGRPGLRSPLQWYGGKGMMTRYLVPLFPPHKCYVETHGGGAWCLFAKPPSPIEVYNDIYSELVNVFRVLQDPEQFGQFLRLVSLTPYSREVFDECRATLDKKVSLVEYAYKWYILARWAYAGHFGDVWEVTAKESNRQMMAHISAWLSTVEQLPDIAARLLRVAIENLDAIELIPKYDTENTFFYVDPPYIHKTRNTHTQGGTISKGYKHEMTDKDHARLLELLLQVKGKVMVSGYQNELYRDMLEARGWERIDFTARATSAQRTHKGMHTLRIESVWLNYRGPTLPGFMMLDETQVEVIRERKAAVADQLAEYKRARGARAMEVAE